MALEVYESLPSDFELLEKVWRFRDLVIQHEEYRSMRRRPSMFTVQKHGNWMAFSTSERIAKGDATKSKANRDMDIPYKYKELANEMERQMRIPLSHNSNGKCGECGTCAIIEALFGENVSMVSDRIASLGTRWVQKVEHFGFHIGCNPDLAGKFGCHHHIKRQEMIDVVEQSILYSTNITFPYLDIRKGGIRIQLQVETDPFPFLKPTELPFLYLEGSSIYNSSQTLEAFPCYQQNELRTSDRLEEDLAHVTRK
ncbi:MAG: hypothetical protein MMC33_000430 [Icmadophila ericetorum]|nr:hypothetical protein [Icmadophila ericetorum]